MEVSKQGQTWKDSRVSTGSVGNLNLLMKSNQQNSANFQALKQNATNVENIERKQQPALKNILCDVCELPKFNPQENALFCEVFQAIWIGPEPVKSAPPKLFEFYRLEYILWNVQKFCQCSFN